MTETQAQAPDGRWWTVRRVVLPWLPKEKRVGVGSFGGLWVDFADGIGGFIVGLVIGIVLFFVAGPVLAVLIFGFEWMLVLVLVPMIVVWRVFSRRGFPVVAECDGERYAGGVVGWRASADAVERIAQEIRVSGRPTSIAQARQRERRGAPS